MFATDSVHAAVMAARESSFDDFELEKNPTATFAADELPTTFKQNRSGGTWMQLPTLGKDSDETI